MRSAIYVLPAVLACATLPRTSERTSPEPAKTAARGPTLGCSESLRLEIQNAEFDGRSVSLRLLAGASGRPIELPRRFVLHKSVVVDDVLDCSTNHHIPFLVFDDFRGPDAEEVVRIDEKYWYGADLRFLLFGPDAPSFPECIRLGLQLWLPCEEKPSQTAWIELHARRGERHPGAAAATVK